jgi:bacteriocin biosynthesis cyclodehydratase domain-containing protein
MRPLLLPGTHLLRRDAQTVQPGLHARCVLPAGEVALSALVGVDAALTDDRPLRAALPAAGPDNAWLRHTLSALARRTRQKLPAALDARKRGQVVVAAFGHPMGGLLAADVRQILSQSGIAAQAPGPVGHGLRVLVGVGEPRRDLLDPFIRSGTPHLLVRLVEGAALVGPLVVPGETACLRCVDAYLTERDPAWPLLVEQYARASAHDRPDGIPEPVDAALAAVAVGWAARDTATYLEGERPSTWSTTIRLSPRLDDVEVQSWPAHPHCGCAWA